MDFKVIDGPTADNATGFTGKTMRASEILGVQLPVDQQAMATWRITHAEMCRLVKIAIAAERGLAADIELRVAVDL